MIAVLGATGRTGRIAARTLKANGREVRHVLRTEARAAWLAERGEDVAVASIDDEDALARALAGASAIYALLPDHFGELDFHRSRRRMGDAIAAAVERAGVRRVVFASSSIAPIEESGLGRDLAHVERALLVGTAAVTILRAAYFQDNVLDAATYARAEGVFPCFFPERETRIATVAARDVGLAAARALLADRDESEILDVVGPSYSPSEMARALGRALGRPLHVAEIPPAAHAAMFAGWGMSPEAARAMAETLACLASGRAVPSGRRIEAGTTTLDETLRDALGAGPMALEGEAR
jgi:NAD(P)H dehydrogenase (quinone)